MKNKIGRESEDRVSMGMSVFIALCVVGVFCAVSIAVMENIGDTTNKHHKEKHIHLKNNNDFFVL